MMLYDSKEDAIREEFFHTIRLSKTNREIAGKYLHMDDTEAPELLEKAEHQDLASAVHWMGTKANYVRWLLKKNRTEELGRLVRLLAAVGGSTAWKALTGYEYGVHPAALEKSLVCLKDPHAEAQKMALRAGLCSLSLLIGRPEDAKEVLRSGQKDPGVFLEAVRYCYNRDQISGSEQERNACMLLQAMYLYYMEEGTALETVRDLEERLTASIADVMAFEPGELSCIQEFAKTADRETPFPHRILSIYSQRRSGANTPALLSACAFLALRHSVRFEIILRLMAAIDHRYQDRNLMLATCRGVSEEEYYDTHMAKLEDMLPIPDENYIIWCLEYGDTKAVERMAVKCPDGIRAAAEKAEFKRYRELMEILQRSDLELYREMKVNFQKTCREKAASEIVSRVCPGRADAKEYLLGNRPVETLEPYLKEWGSDLYEEREIYERLKILKKMELSMYRRGIVLEALRKMAGYFAHYPVFDQEPGVQNAYELLMDTRQMEGILQIFEEEGISVRFQIEALGGMGDCLDKKRKVKYLDRCVELFAGRGKEADPKQWEEDMAKTIREGSPSACCLCLRVLEQSGGEAYRDLFLSCAAAATKQVRTLLLEICRAYREWMPEILALLGSGKVKEREFAVRLLEEWGDPSCLEEVQKALEREKNRKLALSLQELAKELEKEADGADAAQSGRARRTEEKLAAEIYKGSKKKKVEWVLGLSLPEVHRKDGEAAAPEYLFAILTAYADMEFPGINKDADRLAAALAPEELSAYMQALYEGWLSRGAEAKKRWVLYAVSIHGGSAMVPALHSQIKDWAEHSRGAMAAETVHALTAGGSPEALRLVDQMSRKFKFRQVKNAAGEALKHAAAALGISREELEDRLVPDLGLNENGERMFDYGSRSFRVRLSPALEAEVYDEKGKRLKNLPALGRQDDPEKADRAGHEFKQMKRQLKETVSSQKLRLEQTLHKVRFWEPQKWRELFVDHPVMHPFAVGLIWGVYEDGVLRKTFRYMEDGSCNTAEEEEYLFPKTGQIGLVHPLELSEEELAAWKEQLSDYEITQPLEQLSRPVFRLKEEEKEERAFARFEDQTLNGLTLSGRLLKMGWLRGEILDAGFYESYYRIDGEIGAELTFSGSTVGQENEEVTIRQLYFCRITPPEPGSSAHRAFRKENRCLLKEVDPRYFSETVLQAAKAAGM